MAKAKRVIPAYALGGKPGSRFAGAVFPQLSTLAILKEGLPMQTFPVVALLASLADMLTNVFAAGVVKLHLYKSNTVPGPGDVIGSYTEADYDGYVAQVLVPLGAAYINPQNVPQQDFQLLNFDDTGAVTPNTIYGYYVGLKIGAGAETLLFAERLTTPFVMDHAGATLNIGANLMMQTEF